MCFVTLTAPKLAMQPGGPGRYVSPAPREHGRPEQAFVDPLLIPLLTPTLTPLVVPMAEDLAAVATRLAVGALSTAVAPAALILALILGSVTSAQAPGLPQVPLAPPDRDTLRLWELEAKHAAGTLTADEQAELIGLLAKVRGLHVDNLADIDPAKKPRYAPVIGKWLAKKGRIDVLKNGNWKYTDWEGNSVVYEGDEPNFDAYQRQQVDIEDMQGNCTSDFDKADEKAPLGPILDGNTWHHKNNLRTMQEVPTSVHQRFTHYGARSIIKKSKASPEVKKSVIRKRKP